MKALSLLMLDFKVEGVGVRGSIWVGAAWVILGLVRGSPTVLETVLYINK